MSIQNVRKLIEESLADHHRFQQLMSHPEEAFKGYDLSDAEKEMLRGLSKSPYTLTQRGLQDVQRLVAAAIEFGPHS